MPERPASPSPLFYFHLTDGSEGVIVLEHVCMARWTKGTTHTLSIYFKEGPHVALGQKEGEEFLTMLTKYHDYSRAMLDYTP